MADFNTDVVDEQALLAAMGNDWDTVRAIVRTYKRALVSYRTDLQRVIGEGDAALVREIAHKLKGALANLRAPKARAAAEALEAAAKTGQSDRFAELSQNLLSHMAAVESFFEAPRFREPQL